jgi:hypothetical protein
MTALPCKILNVTFIAVAALVAAATAPRLASASAVQGTYSGTATCKGFLRSDPKLKSATGVLSVRDPSGSGLPLSAVWDLPGILNYATPLTGQVSERDATQAQVVLDWCPTIPKSFSLPTRLTIKAGKAKGTVGFFQYSCKVSFVQSDTNAPSIELCPFLCSPPGFNPTFPPCTCSAGINTGSCYAAIDLPPFCGIPNSGFCSNCTSSADCPSPLLCIIGSSCPGGTACAQPCS